MLTPQDTRPAHHAQPASQPGPPALASLTAAALTTAGHHVTGPDDTGWMQIGRRLAQCALIVSDTAHAELHWTPHVTHADPHTTASLAAALLTGRACPRHPDAKTANDITPHGIAGMDLRAGGYTVALTVHTDDYYYDVTAELTITHPAVPGTVYITDDGSLSWHADYRMWPPDPAAAARAIAAAITRATRRLARPPEEA